MSQKAKSLLRQTTKPLEIALGIVLAVISVSFAALLVWLVYIVSWRNPQKYGTHDLFKWTTILIFLLLFAIAFGFSIFAFRLLNHNRKRLVSPALLRFWGVFFAAGSGCVLIECIVKQNWAGIRYAWEALNLSISMAIAAFVLAQKQK